MTYLSVVMLTVQLVGTVNRQTPSKCLSVMHIDLEESLYIALRRTASTASGPFTTLFLGLRSGLWYSHCET